MNRTSFTRFINPVLCQGGGVLLTSLVLVLILALSAITTMRISTLELRMAGNEQQRLETFELTRSILDEVAGNPDHFQVRGSPGRVNCTPGVAGCAANGLAINNRLLPSSRAGNAQVTIERLAPALSAPPRAISTSSDAFSVARFEVDATYDGTEHNEGRVAIVQGLLVLVPRGTR